MMKNWTAITTTTRNQINSTVASTFPRGEENNLLVKGDILPEKESVNVIFSGHVHAGKLTIAE